MEKRFYLGLAILALLLSLSILASVTMTAIHKPMTQLLEDAAAIAMEDDLENALPMARSAYARWQKYRPVTASFADHNPMDDTDTQFKEMLIYGQAGEIPHFAACCRQLAVMTEAMYDAHVFSLKNLL